GECQSRCRKAGCYVGGRRPAWRQASRELAGDFGVKPAACSGSGSLTAISLGNISRLMKDEWVEGSAGASYEIQGPCAADFWQSSEGTLQVDVADGSLPHVLLRDSAKTLKIRKFTAEAQLHAGTIEVSEGELDSPEGTYEVSGTATLN